VGRGADGRLFPPAASAQNALEKLHVEQDGIEALGEQMQQLVERLDSPP
jgi:hypothetical protein